MKDPAEAIDRSPLVLDTLSPINLLKGLFFIPKTIAQYTALTRVLFCGLLLYGSMAYGSPTVYSPHAHALHGAY